MDNLELYLTTRIEALDVLIKLHLQKTGDSLVMERAICELQLDKLKQIRRKADEADYVLPTT